MNIRAVFVSRYSSNYRAILLPNSGAGDIREIVSCISCFTCAQALLRHKEKGEEKLLELSAPEHLEKAKEYALDVSEFSHLYQSQDPDFYKDIPEYDMLKRGMSQEERIRNGYYVAYRMAEILGSRD